MKKSLTILLVVGFLFSALLGLPLLIGVWLPDVISASEHTLAEQRLASGHSFRVIQYWNRGDFYNTELLHTSPDGVVEKYVLDADDDKSWSVSLVVDELHKSATITLGGGRVKQVEWQ
jgi:hypothetical protein